MVSARQGSTMKLGKGDRVEVIAGAHAGQQGDVTVADAHAVYLETGTALLQVRPHEVKLIAKAPPPPYVFNKVHNPDGWREPTEAERASLPTALASGPLAERLFFMHERPYLAVRGLEPAAVEGVFAETGPALGLQINHLGVAPGLKPWLAWDGLGELAHLSCNTAFLGAKGLEALLRTERLERLETLDLGVCDLGHKGLKLLKTSSHMPRLTELYLGANTDYDKTKYDAKALAALLQGTAKAPLGESLRGLRVLGLMFWSFAGADALLEKNEVIRGLDTLWVWKAKELPASLRAKCVEGWKKARPAR